MNPEERCADCEDCGERFVGLDAIATYLTEVFDEVDGESVTVCHTCAEARWDDHCRGAPDDDTD